MMTIFVVLAVLLIAAAASAIVAAARMTTRNRIRHWNGDAVSVSQSQKQHALIRNLRLAAGLCILLLAADGVAIYTAANYVAAR